MTPESCLESCSDEICTYSIHNESKCSGSPLAGPIHQEQIISESSRPYHDKWLYLLINAPGCVLTLYTTDQFSGSSQSYSGAGCHGIQQDLSTGLSIRTSAKCVEGASTPENPGPNPTPKPAPKPCYKKVQNMPQALATESGVADACDGGIYGQSCVDFPDLEEGDKCEVAQTPLGVALLQKDLDRPCNSTSGPCNDIVLAEQKGGVASVEKATRYSWAGCYTDANNRDLTNFEEGGGQTTVAACQQWAASKNFKYFALQAGNECRGDNSFDKGANTYKPVPSSSCGTECENEQAEGTKLLCGGNWINAVYVTKPEPVSTTSPYTWAGCFWDNNDRDLKKGPQIVGFTVATCQQWALSRNYKYFALQAGGQCMADNTYARSSTYTSVGMGECGSICQDESATGPSLFCGSDWINAVYVTKGLQQVTTNGFAGCYWDNGARDLPTQAPGLTYTVATCRQYAISRYMPYFGVQANGQCLIGDAWNTLFGDPQASYGKHSDSDCGSKCADETAEDTTLKCGADWVNAIYFAQPPQRTSSPSLPGEVAGGTTPQAVRYTSGQNDDWCKSVGISQGWEWTYNGGSNIPPTAPGAWCTKAQLEAYQPRFIGCFLDNEDRAMKNNMQDGYTVETCSQWAVSRNFKYFALQANGQCFGDNTYGDGKDPYSAVNQSQCGGTCTDETSEADFLSCGSGWVNAVYLTFGAAPAAPGAAAAAPAADLAPAGVGAGPPPQVSKPKADCRNITVFQKLDGKVGFANVQLCGGEKSDCYIDNVCKEPTTTVTTTTITVTTSTTTTVVYECHCKVFAEGQGPGCAGKCCVRENDEGGEGFDTDCSTETDETGCNQRLNGANQNFCVYKKQAYWKSLAT